MTNWPLLTLDDLTPENLPNFSSLTLEQETDLKLAIYYLHRYRPPAKGSNLEQVQGQLEAIYHLGNLSAWSAAAQLLRRPFSELNFRLCSSSLPLSQAPEPTSPPALATSARPLHEQLNWWGYYHQQRELCQQLLGKVDQATDCLCLGGLAQANSSLGYASLALDYCQQQLSLARHLGDQPAELMALRELGSIYSSLKQFKMALASLQQQLTLARRLEHHSQECFALAELGHFYLSYRRSRQGLTYLLQAETLAQRVNDLDVTGFIMFRLGQSYLFLGQYQKAIDYLQRCLEIEGVPYERQTAVTMSLAAAYCMGFGQTSEAEQYFHRALALSRQLCSFDQECYVLNQLSVLYIYVLHQPDLAIPLLRRALQCLKVIESKSSLAILSANLCNSYAYLGDYEQAQIYADAAIAASENDSYPEERAIVLATLGHTFWQQGQRFRGLGLTAQSLWILPPWRSVNGHLILRSLWRELVKLWQQWLSWLRPE